MLLLVVASAGVHALSSKAGPDSGSSSAYRQLARAGSVTGGGPPSDAASAPASPGWVAMRLAFQRRPLTRAGAQARMPVAAEVSPVSQSSRPRTPALLSSAGPATMTSPSAQIVAAVSSSAIS